MIAVPLEHIHIPGHRLAVQGAALRQDQLVCLLLRSRLQAGNILEVAARNAAAVLGQLTVGAAVNGAVFQLCFGVSAAQNAGIRVLDPKLAIDHAAQQIYFIAGSRDGHIAAGIAIQNILCLCVCNAGNGQPVVGAVVAPAGAGLLFGQTVRADLDRNDGICCFLVRTGSCRLCCRSRRPSANADTGRMESTILSASIMLTMRFFMISSPLLIDLPGCPPKQNNRNGQKAKLSITLKFMEIKHFRPPHLPKFGTKIWAKSPYGGGYIVSA